MSATGAQVGEGGLAVGGGEVSLWRGVSRQSRGVVDGAGGSVGGGGDGGGWRLLLLADVVVAA